MGSLATLGDSFLELVTVMSYYHRYPSDDIGELTKRKKKEVSNENLYQLSAKKELKCYINCMKTVFHGENANWIPPGYTTDEDNSERYLKQKVERKSFADMIEALIGALLISTNCSTTIKFMKWLGLDVIPTDEEGKH
jgi:endoribonuclease Dicer